MARRGRLGASSGSFLRNTLFSVLILLAIAALALGWLLFEMERPTLELGRELTSLGGQVELPLKARDDKSGLSLVSVDLRRGDTVKRLLTKRFPRKGWFRNAGPKEFAETLDIKARDAGLADGPAELVITVRDQSCMGWLAGNMTELVLPVQIDTAPPKVQVINPKRHIQSGGSAVVAYTVSEPPAKHGVVINNAFFPGAPTPKKDSYVCYFALPWNAKALEGPVAVVARDEAGNEARAPLTVAFRPRKEKHDTIRLSDAFFERKLPEFRTHYPEMQGDMLEQYLYVNREVRRQNAAKVAELCRNFTPDQLWQDRFVRMPGAGRAAFADQRTYMYQGRAVDEQTHLGVDIASVARDSVKAANRGKVVFAGFLGIYGNTVLLDHGQGLFSLYAHLSDIAVTSGTLAEQGQLLGHSGLTGMAGGDHLHYSMLVHGVFVTPVEWWDQHWIDINIKAATHE